MSSPSQTETVAETGKGSTVMGSLRSMARRLSGTFIGAKANVGPTGKDKRPHIYSYEEDSGLLKIGSVLAQDLAENFKTPLYVYDVNRIVDNFYMYMTALQKSVPNNNFLLSYAVKANPSLGVLDIFRRLGSPETSSDEAGKGQVAFSCVSGGEVARVQQIGVDVSSSVIFSGLGKTPEEIEMAVQSNIYCFNVESWAELEYIETAARKMNKEVNISIRVNPEISAAAANADGPSPVQHRFGVAMSEVMEMSVRAKASAFLRVKGLAVHLQVTGSSLDPYIEARDKLLSLADTLRSESRIWIEHINLGGGFPVGLGPDLSLWIEKLAKPVADRGLRIILCPGRSLVADAGVLLSRVTVVKKVNIPAPGSGSSSPRRGSLAGIVGGVPSSPISPTAPMNFSQAMDQEMRKPKNIISKNFAVLDASFSDFGSRGLNSSSLRIIPGNLTPRLLPLEFKYDIVGSTVEAADVFGRDYPLSEELKSGESLVAFTEVGAYAFSLSGNYSSRNRPAEVLVKDKGIHLIRERESYSEQFLKEKAVPASSLPLPPDPLSQKGLKEETESIEAGSRE